MKDEIMEIVKKQVTEIKEKKISRKEAIKKTGYLAASAATMMILLSSPTAQACSPGCNDHDHKRDHKHDQKRDHDKGKGNNQGNNGPWKG